MTFLMRLKKFLDELEPRQLNQYLATTVGVLILLLTLFVYLGYARKTRLLDDIEALNRNRVRARELLVKQKQVVLRKNEVDTVLTEDRLFYIKDFFTQTINELGLLGNISKEAEVSEPQDLKNKYSEVKLDVGFSNLSTQQLCELLLRLEKNKRIYLKEVDITKAQQNRTINATIVIATLQPSVGS